MQAAQQQPIPGPEVDLALDRATQELNTSYMRLCERVERLTGELHQSRTQLVRELTEKEVIFQRLSALVQALPGGMLLVDRHDIIRDANPQQRRQQARLRGATIAADTGGQHSRAVAPSPAARYPVKWGRISLMQRCVLVVLSN